MARTAVTASCVWHAVLAAVVVFAASSTTRAAAHAAPASHAHAALASGWKDLGRVADDEPVPVVLALRHGISDAALESHCTDIADPASDRYGHHLSRAALAQLLRSDAHREAVEAWLRDAGVRDWQVGGVGDSVAFVAPAATVNAVLGARMHLLETPGGILVTRSVSGHAVPNRVAGAVELVLGVSDFVVGEAGGPGSPASSLAARMSRAVATAPPLHAASASLRGAAPADGTPSPPTLILSVVTTTTVYAAFFPSAPGFGYDLIMSFDGAASVTVTVDPDDVDASAIGFSVVQTDQYVKPYTACNVSIAAVNVTTGARSAAVALPMDWASLPKTYKGDIGVPAVTPQSYASYYGLTPASSARGRGSQAVAEFLDGYMNFTDLATYASTFNLTHLPATTVIGPNQQGTPGLEAQMDVELIEAVSPSTPTTFWSVALKNKTLVGSYVLEWAMQVNDSPNPPLVNSLSYGIQESTPLLPADYFSRTNNEFVKLCVRGVSVLFACGDAGASGDGHGTSSCGLNPFFPASSPWVTAVGASTSSPLAQKRQHGGPNGEIPVSIDGGQSWTTGGGFSDLPSCRQPAYQSGAVQRYLNLAPLPKIPFNKTGRAYPDVASIGTNYWMTIYGDTYPIGDGTSSATPTFAGIVSLLNEAVMEAGGSPLGFLNPMLYSLASSHPEVFYDITLGNNRCGQNTCCEWGYEAAKGWDAVSGLGSVGNYPLLKSIVVGMASAGHGQR